MSLVVHIGIPKSGTTFLQTQVFACVDGLHCIGRPHANNEDYRAFRYAVMHEEDEDRAQQVIAAFFDRATGGAANEPAVLSEEAICFAPLWHVAARRLAGARPDATILITLRSQLTAVTSFYANHGRLLRNVPDPYRGRHVSFDNWLRFAEANLEVAYLKNYLRILFFDRLADVFARYFGEEKIRFLFYENMVREDGDFAEELSNVLGIDCLEVFRNARQTSMNPRSSEAEVSYNALRSRLPLLTKSLRMLPGGAMLGRGLKDLLHKGRPAKVVLKESQHASLSALYRESNQRLASRFGLPLKEFGYPI